MPRAVEECVNSILAKWKKDPSSRPKPREAGQDEKDQAWAICQAAYKNRVAASLELMLEDGFGPALIGAAATNRPYIPRLEETKVISDGDNKKLRVHLANAGHFQHPSGPFTLNRIIFHIMAKNLDDNIIGARVAYDSRHKSEQGAIGWFEKLEVDPSGKRLYGIVDPTPAGLELIEGRQFIYSSMEFHRNYKRDDVVLDLEHASDEVCILELDAESTTEEKIMADTNELENERDGLRLQLGEAQTRLDTVEAARKKAEERIVALEKEALSAKVNALVSFIQSYRDKDGNAHPAQLATWAGHVLRFENLGEGDGVVHLEEDYRPAPAVVDYLVGAIKELVTTMPGIVPLERVTQDGSDKKGGEGDDDFDYAKEWNK